jgi:hypothetical protein
MTRLSIALLIVAPISAALLAADKPAARANADMQEMQIALSPVAAKRAERREKIDLYRDVIKGDAKAKEKWQKLKPEQRVSAMAELAVSNDTSDARKRCIHDLAMLSPSEDPEGAGAVALARVAVADHDGGTRNVARNGLAFRNDSRVLAPLATALKHKDPLFRENAARALRGMGGGRVFEVIIEHWRETWGPGARAHCFFGQQRSYVADYDVSGDAYDPVVRSFFTGTVLDAKSLRVEGDIYYMTIREVAPEDVKLPNDPAAWKNWAEREKEKIAADAREKRARASSFLASCERGDEE